MTQVKNMLLCVPVDVCMNQNTLIDIQWKMTKLLSVIPVGNLLVYSLDHQ